LTRIAEFIKAACRCGEVSYCAPQTATIDALQPKRGFLARLKKARAHAAIAFFVRRLENLGRKNTTDF
jgi:hypothetical protein